MPTLADRSTSTSQQLGDLADLIEGRRRLVEATREAARWHTPKRRIRNTAKAVSK